MNGKNKKCFAFKSDRIRIQFLSHSRIIYRIMGKLIDVTFLV